MYPPHHQGGYELAWRGAMDHLRRRGHRVTVLTTDHREPGVPASAGEEGEVRRELRWYWRDHAFPRYGMLARLRIERHNRRVLARSLAELAPDAVSWWAMGGMSLSLIEQVRRAGIPASGVVGDDWMDYGLRTDAWQRAFRVRPYFPAGVVELLTGVPVRLDLDAAAEWLFVSEAVRRHARDCGHALPRSRVEHNGVDPARFPVAPARDWEGRLLYVGRIDPRKGIEVALRALARLPGCTLRIVGSGDADHLAGLQRLAAELRVVDRVEFGSAPHERIAEEYARADAVVFPSLWREPFGLVPLEAMAVGRPVVATGTGGSGEYLSDGENCLIYSPPEDPEALARAVERLAADPELRARLRAAGSKCARALTEERFNAAVEASLIRVAGEGI